MIQSKKILFVGFFDDFARFYHGVADELDFDCYFVFQNLSGFLYSILRKFSATYLFFSPAQLFSKKITNAEPMLGNDEIMYILEYGQIDSKFRRFILRKLYYFWYQKLLRLDINTILIAGDSRPISRLFKVIGQHQGSKIHYFEQGPKNTTILDDVGVNSNSSFRERDRSSYFFQGKYTPGYQPSYSRNPIYRSIDYFFDLVFVSIIFPIFAEKNLQIWFRTIIAKKKIKKYHFEKYDYSKSYVLLILQVPEDANMVMHSHNFSSFYDMVYAVHAVLPSSLSLLIREHPLYKYGYESRLYSLIQSEPNIFLDSQTSLEKQITQASLVVVNNSTVGFEAILLKSRLLVLGDSYYDQYKFLKKLSHANKLGAEMQDALVLEIDHNESDSYIAWSFSKNFIKGHFRNKDITSLCKRIASKL